MQRLKPRQMDRAVVHHHEFISGDIYHTCSVCREIKNHCKSLDDKPICFACLDDKLYGAYRKVCIDRGYHETHSTGTDSSRWENGGVTATCKCTHSHDFWGMPSKRHELGNGMPEPPRYWRNDGTPVEVAG